MGRPGAVVESPTRCGAVLAAAGATRSGRGRRREPRGAARGSEGRRGAARGGENREGPRGPSGRVRWPEAARVSGEPGHRCSAVCFATERLLRGDLRAGEQAASPVDGYLRGRYAETFGRTAALDTAKSFLTAAGLSREDARVPWGKPAGPDRSAAENPPAQVGVPSGAPKRRRWSATPPLEPRGPPRSTARIAAEADSGEGGGQANECGQAAQEFGGGARWSARVPCSRALVPCSWRSTGPLRRRAALG